MVQEGGARFPGRDEGGRPPLPGRDRGRRISPEKSDGGRATPWFSGQDGEVVLYRINRRPLPQGSMFATAAPTTFFDHLVEVLLFGEPFVTGRAHKREWRLGNRDIMPDGSALTGQLGWTGEDTRPRDAYDNDRLEWEDEVGPDMRTARAPFAIDARSRVLGVLKHRSFSDTTVAAVFEGLLRRGEFETREPTTEWSVEPILDEQEFRAWLAAADAVLRLTMVAKLPNPDPLPEFEGLWSYLEERKARLRREVLEARDDSGLANLQQDETVRQVVAMGTHGFGYVAADGLRNGRRTRYDQRESGARERTGALPATWPEAVMAIVNLLRERRHK
jgi:hypothetical protein